MFYCAISGEPPNDPVISTKSGHVYERSLITKYINENGNDPMTGEKLEEADLVTVKASPKSSPPRPPAMTSIPALLHTLQNEWDALVLETFALKQQYNATRQELSHALYQQDAATRVVARVMKERDAAREALANVQATLGQEVSAQPPDVEMSESSGEAQSALPAETGEEIASLYKELSSARKKRKVAEGYTDPAQIASFTPHLSIPSLHKSSPAGINSFTLSRNNPSHFLTGGNDKMVQVFDSGTSKVVASLAGHTKKVTHVAFREVTDGIDTQLILSGSVDKTARIWSLDSASQEYTPLHTIKTHKGEISGLSVLPTRTLLALASSDKSYSIHDLKTMQSLYHSAISENQFTSAAMHPDGLLLALGTTKAAVQIYDVRSGTLAATLALPDPSPYSITTSSFSENGYHLCAPGSTSSLNIWDLRHLKPSKTINLGDNFIVNRVKYDVGSALLLGVAGNEGVKVYRHKTWDVLASFEAPGVVDIDWVIDASQLWGAGGREVRSWGLNASN